MSLSQAVDVVIVGGGPAGATAAILLARSGFSTLLLELRPGASQKVAETTHPMANGILYDLGIWNRFREQRHRPSQGIVSVWGSDEVRVNDFFYSRQGPGWIVDRAQFDRMLLEEGSREGARVIVGAKIVSFKRSERSEWWDVAFVHDCGLRRIAARYLVDATGRNGGTLGGSLPRRLVHDRLIGAVQHFAVGLPVSYTLIEATQEGWFFSTSLRDRVLTVIYFTDADLYAKAKGSDSYPTNVLRKASQTWSRINNTDPVGTPLIVSAATSRRPQVSGQGWISVGDAAQSFDPLSSLGIVKAIDSAARACITVTSTLRRGERSSYQQWSDAVFSQYWQTRHRFYSAEMRWPDSIFWRRRHEETEASRSWEGFAKAP